MRCITNTNWRYEMRKTASVLGAVILLCLTQTAQAHGYGHGHHHHHHHSGSWAVPVILGGVIGYEIARSQNQVDRKSTRLNSSH